MRDSIEDTFEKAQEECEEKLGQCTCKVKVSAGQTNLVPTESTKVVCEGQLSGFTE